MCSKFFSCCDQLQVIRLLHLPCCCCNCISCISLEEAVEIESKKVEWEEETKDEESGWQRKDNCEKLKKNADHHRQMIPVEKLLQLMNAFDEGLEEYELNKKDIVALKELAKDAKKLEETENTVKQRVQQGDKTPVNVTGFQVVCDPNGSACVFLTPDSADPDLTPDSAYIALIFDSIDSGPTPNSAYISLTFDSTDSGLTPNSAYIFLTSDSIDSGPTPGSAEPGPTPDSVDPGLTPVSADPGLTRDSADPSLTLENADPSLTPDSVDPGLTPESTDPGLKQYSADPGLTPNSTDPGLTPNKDHHKPMIPMENVLQLIHAFDAGLKDYKLNVEDVIALKEVAKYADKLKVAADAVVKIKVRKGPSNSLHHGTGFVVQCPSVNADVISAAHNAADTVDDRRLPTSDTGTFKFAVMTNFHMLRKVCD